MGGLFFSENLQNVMAVTDCLPCSGNLNTTNKGATAMILVILAMAVGMALTTAFGFGLLPL
jgi:hypothetical protein